jgi:hypothetical protein
MWSEQIRGKPTAAVQRLEYELARRIFDECGPKLRPAQPRRPTVNEQEWEGVQFHFCSIRMYPESGKAVVNRRATRRYRFPELLTGVVATSL